MWLPVATRCAESAFKRSGGSGGGVICYVYLVPPETRSHMEGKHTGALCNTGRGKELQGVIGEFPTEQHCKNTKNQSKLVLHMSLNEVVQAPQACWLRPVRNSIV